MSTATSALPLVIRPKSLPLCPSQMIGFPSVSGLTSVLEITVIFVVLCGIAESPQMYAASAAAGRGGVSESFTHARTWYHLDQTAIAPIALVVMLRPALNA